MFLHRSGRLRRVGDGLVTSRSCWQKGHDDLIAARRCRSKAETLGGSSIWPRRCAIVTEHRQNKGISMRRSVVVFVAFLSLSGCGSVPPSSSSASLGRWLSPHRTLCSQFLFEGGNICLRARERESHVILLLHELPRLTSAHLTLVRHLAHGGFRVYYPVMFGRRWGGVASRRHRGSV
jgi:hypothetical protein